jgi:8-oxo-dGTP pyrophosphatase MutT (NUDIX family)
MSFIDPQLYYQSLPQKRVAVGALIFNEQGEILILKPNYKNAWMIPGGVVEKDESLSSALFREIKEEIGLDLKNEIKLAALDYRPAEFSDNVNKSESLQVLFDCGVINRENQLLIKLDKTENTEYKFCSLSEAMNLLITPLKRRISAYINKKTAIYLNNGL